MRGTAEKEVTNHDKCMLKRPCPRQEPGRSKSAAARRLAAAARIPSPRASDCLNRGSRQESTAPPRRRSSRVYSLSTPVLLVDLVAKNLTMATSSRLDGACARPLASAMRLSILPSRYRSCFVISRAKSIPPNMSRRGAGALALIALIAIGASGCGRRGALEPPPDPNAVAQPEDPAHPRVHHAPPKIVPPKVPFVLDPML
jgi:predicted small lipoprotein YifL